MKNEKKAKCRDCVHFVKGYSLTTQQNPVMVCALKPKRIYRGDCNGVYKRQYFYSTKPNGWCEEFSKKDG